MRDVTTVAVDEPVSIWVAAPNGRYRMWSARFLGFDTFGLSLDIGVESSHWPWESAFWVEDSRGEVIRPVVSEPVLETVPPDLE